MSVEAISWALNNAPGVPPQAVATLIGLANHADPDGRGSYPSQPTLAHYTRKSDRSVRNDLARLEESGLIRRGDQRLVDHLPPDRRPIVWDLVMTATASGGARQTGSDRKHTSARKQSSARKPASKATGSTLPPATGSRLPPNRPVEPTTEPKNTPPPSAGPPTGRGELLPDDFRPTDSMRRWAVATFGNAIDIEYETAQFRSHYRATGARRKSWPDAWQKWVRESAERRTRPRGGTVVPINGRAQLTGTDARVAGWMALAQDLEQEER